MKAKAKFLKASKVLLGTSQIESIDVLIEITKKPFAIYYTKDKRVCVYEKGNFNKDYWLRVYNLMMIHYCRRIKIFYKA